MADRVRVYVLLNQAMSHFKDINQNKHLTDEDRKQLKTFYLENFIAPRARAEMRKHYPNEFREMTGAGSPRRDPRPPRERKRR